MGTSFGGQRTAPTLIFFGGTAARAASNASFPKPKASVLPVYPEGARGACVAGIECDLDLGRGRQLAWCFAGIRQTFLFSCSDRRWEWRTDHENAVFLSTVLFCATP